MQYIKKDDCYLDMKTGLEWSLDNNGPMSWDSAMRWYPSDGMWRLPTIEELITLVDYNLAEPATELPDMLVSHYWSATTNTNYTNYAYIVYFGNGYDNDNDKSNSHYVRMVRGEKKT